MAIKAANVVERGGELPVKPQKKYVELTPRVAANKVQQVRQKDNKIRAEDKPKVKIRPEMKSNDKKIRAEDKVKGTRTVNINRPVQTSQSSTREILKPSRYVEDLMR